jgi:TolB-like protein/Flp pilus assembly protein TadD
MPSNRQLAAIMFTDIVGYTSMMQTNEQLAIKTVNHHQAVLENCIANHHGEVIQYYGDGSLSIFSSATSAVRCAMTMQEQFRKEPMVPLRIGIHIGEVLLDGDRVFGDGVNLASRIESLGKSGTVLFSKNVFEKIRNNTEFQVKSIGEFEFKNVLHPMEVFALANSGFPVPKSKDLSGKLKATSKSSGGKSRKKGGLASLISAFKFFGSKSTVRAKKTEAVSATVAKHQENTEQINVDEKSIAVLPFDNNSNIPEQQYFVDGIADEIRSQLLSLNELKVISRSSSKYYKDKNLSLKQIGRELDVAYVLEGTVQRFTNDVKISVELSHTRTDKLVWSLPPLKHKLDDIFTLESEIAQQVIDQLKLTLTEQEKSNLQKILSRDSEANDVYKKAQALVNRGGGKREDLDQAVRLFEEAIRIDPNFSKAYVGLSDTYLDYIFWGRVPSKKILDKALTAAFKALDLDDEYGAVYGTLGSINFYRFEKKTCEKYLHKAIEMSPSYLPAYEKLSWVKVYDGKLNEALDLLDKIQELDPISLDSNIRAFSYYYAREFERGLYALNQTLEKYPDNNWLLWMKGYLYAGMGEFQKAIDIFQKRTVAKNTNWMLSYALGSVGEIREATEILNFQLKKREDVHVPSHMIASMYMGLGDYDKALEWLERESDEGGHGLFFWGLKNDVKFDPLRENARFLSILNEIKT